LQGGSNEVDPPDQNRTNGGPASLDPLYSNFFLFNAFNYQYPVKKIEYDIMTLCIALYFIFIYQGYEIRKLK